MTAKALPVVRYFCLFAYADEAIQIEDARGKFRRVELTVPRHVGRNSSFKAIWFGEPGPDEATTRVILLQVGKRQIVPPGNPLSPNQVIELYWSTADSDGIPSPAGERIIIEVSGPWERLMVLLRRPPDPPAPPLVIKGLAG